MAWQWALEGVPLQNPWKWIVKGDILTKQKAHYWKGALRQRAAGWRNWEDLLCHVSHSLRFSGGGVSFLGCFWPVILVVPSFDLTQALPGSECISQSWWLSAQGFLRGWRDILSTGMSSPSWPVLGFLWVVFEPHTGFVSFWSILKWET